MNGPNFQLYASNGVMKPIEEQVDTSVYPKQLVDLYTYEGKLYGLPKDMDTVGVWYNKTLFGAAKVKHPADDWTWADFKEAAAELTDPAKGVYAVGAQLTSFQEYQYNTIYQAGGHVISPDGKKSGYDDPKTIEGLRFWTDLIAAKQSPDLKTMTDTAPLQLFEAGKLAMYWGGSWDVAEFTANDYTKDKVDVAPLPKGEKQATIIHGVANVMSAKTEHPAEAWEFVKFLGSKPAADLLGKKGPIPAYNGTQSDWVAAHPELKLQVFLDAVAYAVPYPVSKNTAAWQEAELAHLTKAWTGQVLFCSMAAYAFARLRFPGRNVLFGVFLSVLMVPPQLFVIPQYQIMSSLGWLNSLQAIIVPGLFSAFGVFLLRQFFLGLPRELEEAARLDGAGPVRIYWSVMLPLARPGLVALAILTLLWAWNDLFWPLVVNTDPDKMTLSAGLAALQGQYQTDYPVLMAGSLIASLPVIAVFVFLQRQFVQGIAHTGTKG
ncbi:extracellular solute-binding protein [Nonomuraea diastatica]|uniref:extracellular solute-binding protein n=1 Tax=Nonomuraea diastatica TaxID=1848329 RepID=UPI001FE336AD|nr:extracellular solute-binding protein [Nonomuraea diastatica]